VWRRLLSLVLFAACLVGAPCTGRAQAFCPLYSFSAFDVPKQYPPHNFDGAGPWTTLVQASDGNLYGTCGGGGANGNGTVFRITPDGALTTLYSFSPTDAHGANADGANPAFSLILGKDGNLYGICYNGGVHDCGTIFRITTSGTFSTLCSLDNHSKPVGKHPNSLIQGSDGNFYGTCFDGGTVFIGSVFRVTPDGAYTTLHSFTSPDGGYPQCLIQASDGCLYGWMEWAVFRITTEGDFTILYSFLNATSVNSPASLIQASDGNLYGTWQRGGSNASGTIFRLTTSGTLTTLYNFSAVRNFRALNRYFVNTDGSIPISLMQANDGNLYGMCSEGGDGGVGTVFRFSLDGKFTTLHSFSAPNGKAHINVDGLGLLTGNALMQASDGNFYGTVSVGGLHENGTLFKLAPRAHGFDANEDGFSDLLYRNTSTGDVVLWDMNGLNILNQNVVTQALPSQWQVAGTGDFNGDGRDDVLWRNTSTGDVYLWEMSGSNILNQGYIYQALPLVWQVIGVGDFNGDSCSDILWRNIQTGDVVLWEMDGFKTVNQARIASVPTTWQVAAIGDFNGDKADDVLWRNTSTGDVILWEMSGIKILKQGYVYKGLPPVWQVAGVGDFNGDAMDDILWRNTQTGDVVVWLMNGLATTNEILVAPGVALAWQTAGVGDFNGDGTDDVLWRNASTGDVYLWEMNDGFISGQGYIYQGLPLVWQVLAP
jgi:uncharacterized repeat protein (TIGR03803 family)